MHNLDPLRSEGAFEPEVEAADAMGEADELELANELMGVSSDGELDHFLGKLIRRAARGLGRTVQAATGNSLGGLLKSLAKQALPFVTQALGTAVGGPAGGLLANQLRNAAGQAFGLELEGLSEEDQELELSRRFVRLANAATRQALQSGTARGVRSAVLAAVRRHAPGLRFTGGAPVHVHHHHCTCAGAEPLPVDATGALPAAVPSSEFEEPDHPTVGEWAYGSPELEEPEPELEEPEFEEPALEGADENELGSSGRWYRRGGRIILVGA